MAVQSQFALLSFQIQTNGESTTVSDKASLTPVLLQHTNPLHCKYTLDNAGPLHRPLPTSTATHSAIRLAMSVSTFESSLKNSLLL